MLTAKDIKSIIKGGEDYNVEFKVRLPNKLKELTEEICAFANAAGGILFKSSDFNNARFQNKTNYSNQHKAQ